MFRGKRILTMAAHADDIEYGAFGTLLKYRSHSKIFCFIQEASPGRRLETESSMKMLVPHDVFFSLSDRSIQLENYKEHLTEFETILNRCNPEIILTPSLHDTHQDHRSVYTVLSSAIRRRKISVLCYALPSITTEFRPNVFVDITNFMALKREAIEAHKSQRGKSYMTDEYLAIFNKNGFDVLCGVNYTERFEIERWFF